ncbi:hypothetical protein [Amycolatopsis minnesotensis]|uniref:EF-hand domain-containing protein n=1 Tax=Amycolatopsis minnesotensis TaxID=337894 RepID=A0ABN2SBJ0_9PSEU
MTGQDEVRILIPDHPELRLAAAIEFAGALQHANDPLPVDEGEPWRLPEQLVAADLESALDAAVLHQPHFSHRHIGDTGPDTDTGIDLRHDGVGHMPVYVTTLPREQLRLLLDAAAVLEQAETTSGTESLPALREVREFVDTWREADEDQDGDVSLGAWRTVVRILGLAIADTPAREHRPRRLLDEAGQAVPVADGTGTSPAADTAVLLARIDAAGDTRPVDLDTAAFAAYQRLTIEWHTAIYGPKATSADALLQSNTY